MAGISTGFSLLQIHAVNELKNSIVHWYELDSNLSSSTIPSTNLTFNGTGSSTPTDGYSIITTDSKVGSGCLQVLQFDDSLEYYISMDTPGNLKFQSSFTGWFKLVSTIGDDPTFIFYPFNLNTSFNSNARIGNFGVSTIGTPNWSSRTSLPMGFKNGSTLINHDFDNWSFVYYAYNFNDTSQGLNGSQYFSINNGTLFGGALPAIGTFSEFQGVGVLDVAPYPSPAQHAYGVRQDAISVHNRVLTSLEVSSLYNGGAGRSYSSI